jgi:hypothetical protein
MRRVRCSQPESAPALPARVPATRVTVFTTRAKTQVFARSENAIFARNVHPERVTQPSRSLRYQDGSGEIDRRISD